VSEADEAFDAALYPVVKEAPPEKPDSPAVTEKTAPVSVMVSAPVDVPAIKAENFADDGPESERAAAIGPAR
jgi:hypothetical protein